MGLLGPTELVIYGAVVVVVGVLVWKLVFRVGPVQGFVVLQRWGIARPTREQSEVAADYLRERRRLYPLAVIVLGIGLAMVYRLAGEPLVGNLAVMLGALVGTLLVGELVAGLRRPASSARVSTLVPRRVTDLVPRTWLAASAAIFVLAVLCAVPALAAQAWVNDVRVWSDRNSAAVGVRVPTQQALGALPQGTGAIWLNLALLALVAVSTVAVVRLTLTRAPLVPDAAVDSAVRIRTARVATGTAVLLVAGLGGALADRAYEILGPSGPVQTGNPPSAPDFPGFAPWLEAAVWAVNSAALVYSLAALVCWCGLVAPWRRQRLVEATR